jgi:hypothetical protein
VSETDEIDDPMVEMRQSTFRFHMETIERQRVENALLYEGWQAADEVIQTVDRPVTWNGPAMDRYEHARNALMLAGIEYKPSVEEGDQ